ncbi:hypothetical protein [Niabella drilacis]|uniref:Uncharacterized protein n=1 Tax=Niabella drilacis (strain DSM 25811 / CCM 8410 / CCUG 62505 / LMG 26954 / E90) TaxID=1285928 RepID=A0A1G6X021_NIADE|nr:hypothetical protein [Niabella drilacis]SDD71441.1 hypothetical protein SAMN04487894_11289 [Niabella drilacis]
MKNRFVLLMVLLLLNRSAPAQFEGYYIAKPIDGSNEKTHFILEKTGRFHIFSEDRYLEGTWKAVERNKARFVFGATDPVDLFVSGGNGHAGQICFRGFGNREAFVRIGPSGESFRPIYKEAPRCAYEYYTYIPVNRKECHEITIAIKQPGQDRNAPAFLYTYQIPETYDEIYAVVNDNTVSRERNLSIEYRDGHYKIGSVELEKQQTGPSSLTQVLRERREQLSRHQIKAFRKELYIKKGTVEKILPGRSRKTIRVAGNPVIEVVCPDESQLPQLTLPPPRIQP